MLPQHISAAVDLPISKMAEVLRRGRHRRHEVSMRDRSFGAKIKRIAAFAFSIAAAHPPILTATRQMNRRGRGSAIVEKPEGHLAAWPPAIEMLFAPLLRQGR